MVDSIWLAIGSCCTLVMLPWIQPSLERLSGYFRSRLEERVDHTYNLQDNLRSLRRDLNGLIAKRNDLVRKVKDEQLKGGEPLDVVNNWLLEVQAIETDTLQLIGEASGEGTSSQVASSVHQPLVTSGCMSTDNISNAILAMTIGERVFKKLKEIEDVSLKGVFPEVTGLAPLLVVEEKYAGHTFGHRPMFEKIWESLMNDNNRILGIWGMGGIGKTSLLILINNRCADTIFKDRFDVVIWVKVSKDVDIGKIQDDIGKRLHIYDENWSTCSIEKKACDIRRILTYLRPRFVLLLDDLWKEVSLTAIGIPLPGKGYKVVFTTRFKDVCGRMEANQDIEVQCLAEVDAWNLFEQKSRCSGLSEEICSVAKKIAAKCCGLPLALEVVGKALACKTTKHEWLREFSRLEFNLNELKGIEKGIFEVLKLSYDNLEDNDAKLCFQYCGLFPKAYNITRDELVEYWIAEGIIKDEDGRHRARAKDQGDDIINTLVMASLLLEDGEYKQEVYMHDVIREMALWIVSKFEYGEKFVVKTDAGLSQLCDVTDWTAATKMSLMNNQIESISDDLEFPGQARLITLFLQNNRLVKIVGNFFQVFSTLVVLDLSHNFNITELPEEISMMVQLRYLSLLGMRIKDLPDGLGRLTRLIHLDLESTYNLQSISLISRLLSLQVLRFYDSKAPLDVPLLQILVRLKGLELLTLTVNEGSVLKEFLACKRLGGKTQGLYLEGLQVSVASLAEIGALGSLHNLQMVKCEIEDLVIEWQGNRGDQYSASSSTNQITPFNTRFKNLRAVVLLSCIHLRDLTWLIYAKNLESLSVESSPKMEELINKEKVAGVNEDPFLNLQDLRLHYLNELRSIYWSPLAFPKLNKVDIKYCPKLQEHPSAEKIDVVHI